MTRTGLAAARGVIGMAFVLLWTTVADAQANTTWVSGTGDDANPCSITSACKTFAGAISKTAAGGVINCLEPGSFGAVTITKSLTISCQTSEAAVRASGNGITVRAGPNDEVYLSGLEIVGAGTPGHGISFVSGGVLHVEDVVIRRFNSDGSFGIAFQPTGTSRLFVTNTTIANNGGATGGGILIQPSGPGESARVHLLNVRLQDNSLYGLRIDATGRYPVGVLADIENSQVAGSTTGISILTTPNTGAVGLMVNGTIVTDNVTGLLADGNRAVMRVARSTITNNRTGVTTQNRGTIATYFNNMLDGNETNGAFTQRISPEISSD
jgi:hypothetical protein